MTRQIFTEPSLLQHSKHTYYTQSYVDQGKPSKCQVLGGGTDPRSGTEVEKMYGWCSECRGETGSINTLDVQRGEWIHNSFHSINTKLNKPQQPTWYSPRFSITEFEAQQSTVPERQQFEH